MTIMKSIENKDVNLQNQQNNRSFDETITKFTSQLLITSPKSPEKIKRTKKSQSNTKSNEIISKDLGYKSKLRSKNLKA